MARSHCPVCATPGSVKRAQVWYVVCGDVRGGTYQTPAGDSCAGCRLSTPCPRRSHASLGQSPNRAREVWPWLSAPVRLRCGRMLGVGVERGVTIIPNRPHGSSNLALPRSLAPHPKVHFHSPTPPHRSLGKQPNLVLGRYFHKLLLPGRLPRVSHPGFTSVAYTPTPGTTNFHSPG